VHPPRCAVSRKYDASSTGGNYAGGGVLAGVQWQSLRADPGEVNANDFSAAKLAVNSPPQRDALFYACEQVLARARDESAHSPHDCGFEERARERHIAEAAALERQLEAGCSTVAVGLGIAGAVSGSLAELIETDMRERAQCCEIAHGGPQIRRAAALMWTLVALEAEVEHEISSASVTVSEPARAPIAPAGGSIESPASWIGPARAPIEWAGL
jgi:hypothetical protein